MKILALVLCFFLAALPSLAQGASGTTTSPQPGYLTGPANIPNPVDSPTPSWYSQIDSGNQYNIFTSFAPIAFNFPFYMHSGSMVQATAPSFATFYYVTDIDGNPVWNGTVGANVTSFTIPAVTKYGAYNLNLYGPSVDKIFGSSVAKATFAVVPSNSNFIAPFAYQPFPFTGQYPYTPQESQAPQLHALCDIGPQRFKIPEFLGTQASKISQAQAYANGYMSDLAWDATNGWTSIAADSARPKVNIISFDKWVNTADDIAVATAVSTICGTNCVYIGFNEPQASYTPSQFATISNAFYAAIHAGNSGAQVVGPSVISVDSSNLTWLTSFFALTPNLDQISFHPYGENFIIGQTWTADQSMPPFLSMLSAAGYGSKPLWCDEVGTANLTDFSAAFPRRQANNGIRTALQMERYGIPNQRQSFFYDASRGAWSLPVWLLNDTHSDANSPGTDYNNVTPLAIAFRTLSAQLRGSTFSSELTFGAAANYLKGYQFTVSGGTYLTAFFATGQSTTTPMPMTLSGATSAVDMWGNNFPITNGVPFNLTDMPIYVKSSAPLTVTDVGTGLMSATNTEASWTASVSAGAVTTNVSQINDGLLGYLYANSGAPNSTSQYDDTNNVMPITATLTSNTGAQTVKRVGLFFYSPYQGQTAPISYTLQALESGVWTTIYTYSNPTAYSVPFAGSDYGCTYETNWNCEWAQYVVLPTPITCTALRIVVSATSFGDMPDWQSYYNTGGFPQGSVQHLTMQEFQPFSN